MMLAVASVAQGGAVLRCAGAHPGRRDRGRARLRRDGRGAQPDRSSGRATLTPRSLDPVVLQGDGFKRRERVRVTVTPTSGEGKTKRVRARRDGSFSVPFKGVQACNGFEGVAVGRRGSHASFQFSALMCP